MNKITGNSLRLSHCILFTCLITVSADAFVKIVTIFLITIVFKLNQSRLIDRKLFHLITMIRTMQICMLNYD